MFVNINALVERPFKLTLLNHCRNTALQIQAYTMKEEILEVKVNNEITYVSWQRVK